ncbi:MAG: hypothetical protein KatS3mg003_2273 [Candidatus Nitrosocaldaceae archaeon]|nr:MAG: hypothetical protein KatS3mg003_2273 [Candidatus Nitrosocaldaceae archaeon]
MDAKCPRCERIAVLDDDLKYVRCKCGYKAEYDDYIEDMKERAFGLFDKFIDRI